MARTVKAYLVFICPRCGSIRYSEEGRKTAMCFRCGYKIVINSQKTRILLKTRKAEEAIEAVKRYKMKLRR